MTATTARKAAVRLFDIQPRTGAEQPELVH